MLMQNRKRYVKRDQGQIGNGVAQREPFTESRTSLMSVRGGEGQRRAIQRSVDWDGYDKIGVR